MNALIDSGGLRLGDSSRSASFKRVLACTDFSEVSQAALRAAAEVCKVSHAVLTVLHVGVDRLLPVTSEETFESIAQLERTDEEDLEAMVKIARSVGVRATGKLVEGDIRGSILRKIETGEIDLAVVGTQGARGLDRLIFGSIAEAVCRSATCPVMTVGPRQTASMLPKRSRPIVFATDFHEPAVEAARWGKMLANMYHTAFHCVHVLPESVNQGGKPIIPSIMSKALQELVKDGSNCEIEPVFKILFGNEISHSVIEYAQKHNAQAVVLGVRRQMSYVTHLPPQITYQIISGSPCPVITVPYNASQGI